MKGISKLASLLLLWSLFFFQGCHCKGRRRDCSSSCGVLHNIRYPFRLKEDPTDCGEPQHELSCESGQAVVNLGGNPYNVVDIIYKRQVINVVDPGLHKDDCSSLPLYNISSLRGLTEEDSYILSSYGVIVFVNCSVAVNQPTYVSISQCIQSSSQSYLYAIDGRMSVSNLNPSCEVVTKARVLDIDKFPTNYSEIHNIMVRGVQISWESTFHAVYCSGMHCWGDPYSCDGADIWLQRRCSSCETLFQSFRCFFIILLVCLKVIVFYAFFKRRIVYVLLGRTAIGIFCLFIFLAYKLKRKHIWMDSTVEEFLSNYKYQMPARYSYRDIKKMTKNFKEKLGEGGFGTVFKGKLSNGRLVAIKMLKKSKGNVQEFINEVATIGRTHHVNVVRLIGFCSEGSKRVLIYEFMPNGSLEKYIFNKEKTNALCWNKLYQIILGIARGIEYLHRGCDMRILHFDIKPHNILLDHNFIPKVSDFGLAKFYPIEESIVSVTAARGKIGYMAPELFYKSFGGVSYKSDVYSFGMVLMEMTGRRQKVLTNAENSSRMDFPLWIHDQLHQGGDILLEDIVDDDKEMVKKLIVIALWCI